MMTTTAKLSSSQVNLPHATINGRN